MFKYKLMKRNTASIINLLEQWINEHEEAPPGGQHRDLIDAYLTKIKEESNRTGSTFTGNRSKCYFLPPPGKVMFSVLCHSVLGIPIYDALQTYPMTKYVRTTPQERVVKKERPP